MSSVSCQLSAYPDYLNNRMGLDFSKRYHTDPEYRNAEDCEQDTQYCGQFSDTSAKAQDFLLSLDRIHVQGVERYNLGSWTR